MSKTQYSGLTGFEGPDAGSALNTGPKAPPQQPCEQGVSSREQRREVWLKLLETDGCLGSWNKETGEWIPLL
jgi:hypothetical protein